MNRQHDHDNRPPGPAKSSGEWDSLNAPKRSITVDGANAAPIEAASYNKTNLGDATNSSSEADLSKALKRSITAAGESASPTQSACYKKMHVGDASNGLPNSLVIAWNDQTKPPSAHSKSTTSSENANSNEDTISPHQLFMECLAEDYHGVNFSGTFPQSKWNAIENKHETWNDRKISAVRATIKFITDGLSYGHITRYRNMPDYNDSDGSDESYSRHINASKRNEKHLSINERKFIQALPNCLPLDQGFHVKGNNNKAICFCPCGKAVTPWRETHQVDVDDVCRRRGGNTMTPNSLCLHLKDKGGEVARVSCMLHFSTAEYLRKLHSDDKF